MLAIHLSDPHILAPGELLYRRFDTAEFLARAVAEINRLDPLPDVAVVTGDLVDHGEPPDYEHLRALLAPLAMPVFVIPGITTPANRCARPSPGKLCGILHFCVLVTDPSFAACEQPSHPNNRRHHGFAPSLISAFLAGVWRGGLPRAAATSRSS